MIAVAGTLVADIPVYPFGAMPERGAVNWVDRIDLHLGGIVGNTAKVLQQLGVPVAAVGRVGQDIFGQIAEQQLSSWADAVFLAQDARFPTTTTVVLIHPDGEHSFVAALGAGARFGAEDIPIEQLHELGVRALELGYVNHLPGLTKALPGLLKRLRKLGWLISLDVAYDPTTHWADIRKLLPLVDLFCPNAQEATAITGHTDPEQTARSLMNAGVREAVVIKLGSQGCYLRTQEAKEAYFPGHKVEAVDTTGAGDAFAGGLLAGWYKGLSWERSVQIANVTGAMAVTGLGASEGVKGWEEAVRMADRQG